MQRESRRSAPKNSPNESAMADEYPAPAPPPAQISQAPRPYMMDFKVPEDVFIEDEEEMPPEPITYIDDPIAEPDPNTPPISPRPIDVPMPRNVPTPQVPVPQQPLLPKQPKPISNVENPLPKHEPTTPVVTHPQVEEPKPNDPAATKPSTDEPSKEEKLEDEDALLPLSPNLPPFEFAGYESVRCHISSYCSAPLLFTVPPFNSTFACTSAYHRFVFSGEGRGRFCGQTVHATR